MLRQSARVSNTTRLWRGVSSVCMDCRGGSRTEVMGRRVGISERDEVGFCGTSHAADGFVVGVGSNPVLIRTWSFRGVLGPTTVPSVAGLATFRIGTLRMTLFLILWPLAAVVTSATTGIIVATRFLPGLLLGLPFFLHTDLLGFFNM
jgi:hypothetical protein